MSSCTLFWDVILGWYYLILGWKFIIIYFFNWQTEKNLIWTNKKFVYLIFIGQKISYFRHYVHVRKSPDDMKRFIVLKLLY